MKIPYPTISDKLALSPHMYVCMDVDDNTYKFVKCQTLKPYMLYNNTISHYCDEQPDITRNPFKRTTRIDCDKLFKTNSVNYDDSLKTTSRPDISIELYNDILKELLADGYLEIGIDENELKMLNILIR